MLEVRLSGKFEIRNGGKSVTISSRVAQSLFAYLILTRGTVHRREKLAGMFWPEDSEEKARAYLRHELWRIRKALSYTSNVEYILVDSLTIGFDQSSEYWLDVTKLNDLSDKAGADELMSSLSLYQGEFLPGFYDDWVVLERDRLQAVYETKITRLLKLLESEKRWQEILDWAERWILLGQKPETAYQALMIAYNGLGDQAKVASTYERCVQALYELDLEPSEQTRSLVSNRASKLHIPIPLTSFIGREKELKEVAILFSRSRLVTLTGSGGVGKTRLAIQVAADLFELFPDGVCFLDLAPLNDPKLVPNILARVLDLQLMSGSDLSFTDLIIGYLRSRRILIIFDNCEHLIESCAQLINSLLTSCEHLSILATSREALRVSGEIPYRVPSLEVPGWDMEPEINALKKTESMRLFVERAMVVSPEFSMTKENTLFIAQICKRLDGIPLAIELAAARAHILTFEQILQRLDDRFNLLASGLRTTLPRHQTLRAVIEWSYDLLSESERLLFQRLAVFVGGWTLEAAEHVCSGSGIQREEILELLSHLIYKSLVLVKTGSSVARYQKLETIHQFACEKLAGSSEAQQIHAQHLQYFLTLAQKAESESHSDKEPEWAQKLEDEQENIHAALEWSLQGDVKVGQQLVVALRWWWGWNGHNSSGYEWVKRMLAVPIENEPLIRAKLLDAAGFQALMSGYDEQAVIFTDEALALFRQLGDKDGIASTLYTLGSRASFHSDFDQAAKFYAESCAQYRETGKKWGLAVSLCGLGFIAKSEGNFEHAQRYYEESLLLSNEIGDAGVSSWVLYLLASLANSQGDDARSMRLYEESLHIVKATKHRSLMCFILEAMGSVAISKGDYEWGRVLLDENINLCEKIGDRAGMAYSFHYLAWGALLQGEYAQARSLYAQSFQLPHPIGPEVYIAEALIGVAQLLGAQGDLETFARLLGMAARVVPDFHTLSVPPRFIAETEKFVGLARAALGGTAYAAFWEEGKNTSLEEALVYALKIL